MNVRSHRVFITGGTGYVGRPLITHLLHRGHEVWALVRPGSESKLPAGCHAIAGDALDGKSYASKIASADSFVQLVGVSHPSPSKREEFRKVDLASAGSAVDAARNAGVQHFVYVSVAQPAPVMKAYIEVRSQCEAMIQRSGMNATILRPWYVLGPGHRWPYLLLPVYKLMEMLPSTREGAARLGLVTLEQMVAALVHAVETPAQGVRIVQVPEIRATANRHNCFVILSAERRFARETSCGVEEPAPSEVEGTPIVHRGVTSSTLLLPRPARPKTAFAVTDFVVRELPETKVTA